MFQYLHSQISSSQSPQRLLVAILATSFKMSSPPFNQSMHQSAYNPSYQRSPHRSDHYKYDCRSESPERSHPVHPTFATEVPRDIPRQGQFTPHERYAPPSLYDPSSYRAPGPYDTSPSQAQPYGTSPYQHDQYLAPYPSRQSYEAHPPGQCNDRPTRERTGSVASQSSHRSHRSHRSSTSHRSDRDKYDKNGRRKSSHVESPRPTMSDSVILLWDSIKGAFDSRK
jgi:hypothetical protein